MPAKNSHPGKYLAELMEPLDLSCNGLAHELGVPPNRISAIVNGSRTLTADTALRLARYFRTTPEYWMELQASFDLAQARESTTYTDIKPRSKADVEA